MISDDHCTAYDIGGNLRGECQCSRCSAEIAEARAADDRVLEPEVWLCGACGKVFPSREAAYQRDSSCGTWAVRVVPDSVTRGARGHVTGATAYNGPGWKGGRPL